MPRKLAEAARLPILIWVAAQCGQHATAPSTVPGQRIWLAVGQAGSGFPQGFYMNANVLGLPEVRSVLLAQENRSLQLSCSG